MAKLTLQKIDETWDDDLVWLVFENIAQMFTGNYHNRFEILLKLSLEKQMFYAVWKLDMEVKNGGFNQYYYNSEGKLKHVTVAGLKKVGAVKTAGLVIKANELYVKENDIITNGQDATLQGFSDSYRDNPLNELDKEFYNLGEEENLEKLLVDFVRKNKEKFI